MRKIVLSLVLLLASATLALAQVQPGSPQPYSGPQMSRPTGLGIIVGEPTGISFKQWTSQKWAFDAGFAWAFAGPGDDMHIHADYLWHTPFRSDDPEVRRTTSFYIGIGGRIRFESDSRAGVRVPFGLTHVGMSDVPLDLFFEVAPILDVVPGIDMSVNGGIGLRYFF